ncbi:MAG TPA: CoA ester lyase [Candidatus Sulfotelmatobacter sp.]|nr:CoA ester lyase [Candidatus Sulfotelmatobacter sp.]
MYERPQRLRRVQLSVPGSNEKMMAKAAASAADHVFLDLEDAVAPSAKVEARSKIVAALRDHDWGRKTRCVRINDLTTKYAYGDIISVVEGAREHLDTIMVPKVLSGADVHFAATLLNQIEMNIGLHKKIGIEVLIEEVQALQNLEDICRASPRLECVIFGMGDYSASQGVDVKSVGAADGYPGDIWHYPRFRLAMCAKAAGIDPVDGPYANFKNPEAYKEEARRAMALGCVGKWAIHPAQIEPALEIFTPKQADVDRARKLAAAYAKAEAEGLGAVNIDGVMVDVASIRILRNTILRKADLIGM